MLTGCGAARPRVARLQKRSGYEGTTRRPSRPECLHSRVQAPQWFARPKACRTREQVAPYGRHPNHSGGHASLGSRVQGACKLVQDA